MESEFIIDGVPLYTQADNQYAPAYSCAPTSNAMMMAYCLGQLGYDKTAVGCRGTTQLEDYINHLIDDDETWQWMVANDQKFGSWMVDYVKRGNARRQIFAVEAYAFTRLMEEHGFRAEYVAFPNYDAYCAKILETGLPMMLAGNFSSVSRVGGHVNCAVGFDRKGLAEIITHDPYGDGLRGFPAPNAAKEMRYPVRLFTRYNPTRIDAVVSMRI